MCPCTQTRRGLRKGVLEAGDGGFPICADGDFHPSIHRQGQDFLGSLFIFCYLFGFWILIWWNLWFVVQDGSGRDVDLGIYKDKVLLVVNVASKCGFTNSNYTQLTELYKKYKSKGCWVNSDFEILAFPCNQFLHQEPQTEQEIKDFACTRFKAEFPIFQKVKVNGPETVPVYKFLKASKPGFMGNRIKWNFTKFLIDKEGKVIGRYGTTKSPLSIEQDIQKALGS
ncbi:pectinesterase [Musa troglodytarum]|uniref:Glutathione peroxidase n=1 Tax=Musa troglodytarum TaxID=320322 RepID=A0A9E7FW23_9LILI|nr:pectinesterase [Musa troglodytarum]